MDNRKKYGDDAVDEILAQLKQQKPQVPNLKNNTDEKTQRSVNDLLSSMGLTGLSAPPEHLLAKVEEVTVRNANEAFDQAAALEITAEELKAAKALHTEESESLFTEEPAPSVLPTPKPAEEYIQKTEPAPVAEPVFVHEPEEEASEEYYQEPPQEAELSAEEPYADEYYYEQDNTPQEDFYDEPAAKTAPPRKSGQTTIMDIRLPAGNETDEPVARVGKAAALDRVEAGKYAKDAELLGWFPSDNELYATKKERKQAEKERKRQEAEAKKEEAARRKEKRRRVKSGEDENETDAWGGEEQDEWQAEAHEPAGRDYPEDDYVDSYGEPEKSSYEEPEFTAEDEYTYNDEESGGQYQTNAFETEEDDYHGGGSDEYEDDTADSTEEDDGRKPWDSAASAQEDPTLGFSILDAEETTTTFASVKQAASAPDNTLGFSSEAGDAADENAAEDADAESPTLGFSVEGGEAEGSEPPTLGFSALEGESAEGGAAGFHDTQNYDIEAGGGGRVPTAIFTQEFDPDGVPIPQDPNGTRSLYLNDMVNDSKFDDFFKESVAVGSLDDERQAVRDEKARKRRKKSRSAIITGEFAKLAGMAEEAEDDELAGEEDFEDYNHLQQAGEIEADISALGKTLVRRTVITAILGILLMWLGSSFHEKLPVPGFLSYILHPVTFSVVYLVLIIASIAINFTTFISGLVGLVGEPTVDTPPALACLAAILQGIVLLVQSVMHVPVSATLFGGLMALMLAFNAFGKRVRANSILRNFRLASAGYDHSAAYVLDNSTELAYNITDGLEEEDPTLLISRPTALVKGFLRQSFSQRATDRTARIVGWSLLAFALLAGGLTYGFFKDAFLAVSAFTGLLCIGSPFSSSLVSAVPASLLQKSTARLGAVVPGWSAIEELGQVNVVMATAKDIFPPSSVYLKGIKTFEKERIDLAILYAASVLVEGCDTLRDIFLGVIQGKSDMLYKVESLTKEPGRGFTAWVENSRIVIGNREMLQKHAITPPPIEIEMKFIPEGYFPVYLAVSGKLFAMFIVGYGADPAVSSTLNGLVKSGVSMLVTSDDMNITGELVERIYGLPPGVVKVLGWRELEMLEPMTAYKPESEGVMTHIGTFTSFIGGMRAAAGCAAAERMSSIIQLASVALATLLCIMLMFMGGQLATLSISIALMYQIGWTMLVSALPFARKY